MKNVAKLISLSTIVKKIINIVKQVNISKLAVNNAQPSANTLCKTAHYF